LNEELACDFPLTGRSSRLFRRGITSAAENSWGGVMDTRNFPFAGANRQSCGTQQIKKNAAEHRPKAGWRNGRRKGLKNNDPIES
jgi:hypothetical protein